MQFHPSILILSLSLVACAPGMLQGDPNVDSGLEPVLDAGLEVDAEPGQPLPEPRQPPVEGDGGAVPQEFVDGGRALSLPDAGPPLPPSNIPSDLNVGMYLVIGDSIAAGRNAQDGIRRGGYGYARLMHENQRVWSAYRGQDLGSRFGARFEEVATSGDQSGQALADLRSALRSGLPSRVNGDVVVSISVGGNDFDDDPETMVSSTLTRLMVTELRSNLGEMFRLLRDRYEVGGNRVVLLVHDVHDPTGGTGRIPAGTFRGRCKLLAGALVLPWIRDEALENLELLNAGIAAEVEAAGATLVPMRDAFLDHGMNASSDERWLSTDCVHPNDLGHHEIRALEWEILLGERF